MTTVPSAAEVARYALSIDSGGASLSATHFQAAHDEMASTSGRPCAVSRMRRYTAGWPSNAWLPPPT